MKANITTSSYYVESLRLRFNKKRCVLRGGMLEGKTGCSIEVV